MREVCETFRGVLEEAWSREVLGQLPSSLAPSRPPKSRRSPTALGKALLRGALARARGRGRPRKVTEEQEAGQAKSRGMRERGGERGGETCGLQPDWYMAFDRTGRASYPKPQQLLK